MNLLIVNAVEWSEAHQALRFPDDVGQWITDAIDRTDIRYTKCRVQRESIPGDRYDAVIISGSPASVYQQDAWIGRLQDRILAWADDRIPLLGICFGHQLIAQAFGGSVTKNPIGWELGTCRVEVTDEGKQDFLFTDIPFPLTVMQSHQDVVTDLPPQAVCLAKSPACSYQSFKIGDHIRTVQFHPEYTVEHVRFLIGPRRERLEKAGVDVNGILTTLESTPQSRIILSNFLKYFVK